MSESADRPGATDRERPIIAIDGPAASGKSTVGKFVASALGFTYIDTGALYRAVAWLADRSGITPLDAAGLEELVEKATIRLHTAEGTRGVSVDEIDISKEIRSERIGKLASDFSALPAVRKTLLGLQRRLGESGGVVMDGRDIGTVIFPDAEIKIFLSASARERARRRWQELKDIGAAGGSVEATEEELFRRDEQDRGREHAPLLAAPDAVSIDSTDRSVEEVAAGILEVAAEAGYSFLFHSNERRAVEKPKKKLKIAILRRNLDLRFKENFPRDIEGREDLGYQEEIAGALRKRGHKVTAFTIREDALHELLDLDCDLAFNIVEEGLNNNTRLEPHLPAILDVYGIPYTGGDFLSIALTADKARTKEILSYHAIPTPAFQLFETPKEEVRHDLRYPLIVKPLREDAGIGIFRESVVKDEKRLKRQVRKVIRTYRQPAIAEEYIHGRELSVAVFEHRGRLLVSPLSEVVFYGPSNSLRVYTYTAKWDDESAEYDRVDPTVCPAPDIDPATEERVIEYAKGAFRALRLRGYARVDFRLDEEGRLYIFEVNVNPLIGEESLMAVLARKMGWYFPTFINNIAMEAYRRSLKERQGITLRDIRSRESGPGH